MIENFVKFQNIRILMSLFAACITTLVIPCKTVAQNPPESTVFPDQQPETLLQKVCDTLSSKPAFTVDVDITYDNVLDSGEKVQYGAFQQILVKRPNQLRAYYTGDQRNTSFYYDGKNFTQFSKKLNLYVIKPAPSTIDATVAAIEEKYDIDIPLANLFISNPCKEIIPKIEKSLYVGYDMVNRVPNYHFLFTESNRNFQLWISDDDEPLLQKIVITYKDLPGAPQYTAILSNWNFKPQIPTDAFNFTPPLGAGKIEFLPKVK
ncbi:MAG: hypothetical protein DCF20_01480 [Pseudanabaena sp.]|nr:MAG: hypothetical protein DCF20_01480 [Pseudanabaena sp.]